jgi:hypothetical protein
MPHGTARAPHVRLCGQFTAHTARAVKKIEFFFLSLFIPLSPLSTVEVPPVTLELRLPVPLLPDLIKVLRDLKVTHPSLERLESDSSKSRET